MKYLNFCILLLFLTTLICCNDKEDDMSNPASLECNKLKSRAEAEDLMKQVNDDRYTDSSTIVENLIGEWGLIGTVPGWFGFEPGQECFRLKIGAELIELEDLKSGNHNKSEWKLKTFEVNGYVGFHLETNEDVWNNRMGMQIFSENIMFGSGRVDDGTTYIYEKLD